MSSDLEDEEFDYEFLNKNKKQKIYNNPNQFSENEYIGGWVPVPDHNIMVNNKRNLRVSNGIKDYNNIKEEYFGIEYGKGNKLINENIVYCFTCLKTCLIFSQCKICDSKFCNECMKRDGRLPCYH